MDIQTLKPVPILFTIPNFITAGSGQALWNVAQRLDRQRFSPSICVLKSGGKLEATIREQGIPLLELPFTVAPRPLHTLPVRLWRAAQFFRPYHFAVWHSYHYADDYTEPLIARLSGARGWIYTKKNMGWNRRAWWLRTVFASRIAAQNTAMLKKMLNGPRFSAKTRLLPPGVDTKAFCPGVSPQLNLRKRLGLGERIPLIGCVAHLVPVKGHPTLLKALAAVPDAQLILAGKALDQVYESELHRLCADLGVADRVQFLGGIEDVAALNAELDIFALPTLGRMRMEGCPVALLEAMACGLPCIATNIPGSQDVIESGVNGLLVPPEDETALARAIQSLVDSPEARQQMGGAARQRILTNYTIEREVAAYEALYAELLDV
jgi:glycosyltransferase involved in cell wall biosynthesis